jgi:sugar phosphate isomerase/epimerase
MKKFISSSVFTDFRDSVNFAKELGLNLEISRFDTNLDNIDETFIEKIQKMKEDLKDFSGELSLHAFLFDLSVASSDPLIKNASIKRFEQSFYAAEYLGAKTVVYHTGFNACLKYDVYHQLFQSRFTEFWKDFIKCFEQTGITAVIENLQESSPDFILQILKDVDSPNLGASLDIGHANLHSDITADEWIKQYGEHLRHMHLHNNYGGNDSHFSLLKGTINIEKVLETINALEKKPLIVFEIFDRDSVMESLKFFDTFCLGSTSAAQTEPPNLL